MTGTIMAGDAAAWDAAAEQLDPTPNPHVADPVGWVTDRIGGAMWSKQRDIAESVRDHRYTAVQSCHGVGKSWTVAQLAAWWLDVHPVGEAFVVTTAPTTAQVRAILWREIGRTHRAGGLPGRVTLDAQWKIGDELVAYGRKPADHDQAAFQGIHARYVLVIVDEACGVPKGLFDAVDSLATNVDSRVVAIGNPDDPRSHFATICKPGSGWNRIRISAFDSPNFTGEQVPDRLRPLLVSPEWVDERRRRWGEASHTYIAKVLGKFPQISTDGLIEPGWVLAAQHRELDPVGLRRLGVDVARYGRDRTVIYRRHGPVVRKVEEVAYGATTDTTNRVVRILKDLAADRSEGEYRPPAFHPDDPDAGGYVANVDESGVGGGVVDQLVEHGQPVAGFNGGAAAFDSDRFVNARSEAYWDLRSRFETGTIDLDPADEDLAAQLLDIRWKTATGGRTAVEKKDDIIKRAGISPDHADAVMMAMVNLTPATPALGDHVDTGDRGPGGGDWTSDLMRQDW